VIEEFGSAQILNIELTNYVTPLDGLVYEAVKLVRYYGIESTVLFSSFNPINLWLAKKLSPTIACGYLRSQLTPLNQGISKYSSLQADHPISQIVTAKHVQNAHDIGRLVYVWTVNEQAEMRELKKMGVDGIITNDPVLGVEVFK
jgi:glycerophosphoryl diester phosphodiesterase